LCTTSSDETDILKEVRGEFIPPIINKRRRGKHVCVTSSGEANIVIRNIRGSSPHPIINKEDIMQC
jgi:hypothetical protein